MKPGDRVRVKGSIEEPDSFGAVISTTLKADRVNVLLDEAYCTTPWDSGLRAVPLDRLEAL